MAITDPSSITPSQKKKLAEIVNDPVKWAQAFLTTWNGDKKCNTPWTARWYQAEMLRDDSLKKVYRCGRRTGKCLPGWDLIDDPITGERVTVQELYEKQYANLLTMNEQYKLIPYNTNIIFDNGIKEVFKVTTKSGRSIDATGNHPLFTVLGWKEIDELNIGDKVAVASQIDCWGNFEQSIEETKLLAYMIGDGNCTNKTIRFSVAKDCLPIKNEMIDICSYFDCSMKQYDSSKECDYHIVKSYNTQNKTVKNQVTEILKKHNVYGKSAFDKFIPDSIFKLNKRDTAIFLSRLYATDGWAYSSNKKKTRYEIGYCSVSLSLVQDIQHLLLKFGINSSIQKKKINYNGEIRYAYQLFVYSKQDILKFAEQINIFSKEQAVQNAVDLALQSSNNDRLLPKEILELVEQERKEQRLKKSDLCITKNDRFRMCYDISQTKLKHYGEILNNEDIINFAQGDFIFEEIVSIESLGMHQTYDFTVPETHNFVVNDFITHNTETMVIEALYQTYKNPNYRVLIITPYINQVDLAFKRINELVDASPAIKARVVRQVKNPYQLEFSNHSSILGFTTGASSGSGGASIRGQRADLLILDEVDYMSEADFDSVMIIAGERPDIRTIMSSTPTGKRGKFYQACTVPEMGFNQHFHPSYHNPNWCDKMEAEFRASLTASGYVHEVEAEFGVQDTGVFNKDDLDRARTFLNYAYNPLDYYQERDVAETGNKPQMMLYDEYNPAPFNRFRTMGIDWDKYQASSSIVILDYNVSLGKFMILKRYEMPRAEYSYDAAVNAVIELNNIYKPAWIYADKGAGEYQLERLHIYGDEHPQTGLKNKLKGWSFANKVDVYDPITGEKDSKPMKPFMVNQLQIAFERNNLILSPWDDIIYKQLIDYEVEKMSASGIPSFSSKDEHYIDALGLAYLAMVLEFKKLTGVIEELQTTSKMELLTNVHLTGPAGVHGEDARKNVPAEVREFYEKTDFREIRGERQSWVKLNDYQGAINPKHGGYGSGHSSGWGNRSGGGGFSRKGW